MILSLTSQHSQCCVGKPAQSQNPRYVCGGSEDQHALNSAERFDPATGGIPKASVAEGRETGEDPKVIFCLETFQEMISSFTS